MLFVALKNKKCPHDDNEEKTTFQTNTTELYKQLKQQTKKENLRLVISSIMVGVVAKLMIRFIS